VPSSAAPTASPSPVPSPSATGPAEEPSTLPSPPAKPSDAPAAAKKASPKKDKPAGARKAEQAAGRSKSQSGSAGAAKVYSLTELRQKYADSFIFRGSSAKHQIALTFDDAPDTLYTPQVLDILKKHNVKATFFVIGKLAEKHPDIVKRIAREGHVLGNHTYNHPQLKKLTMDKFIEDIEKSEAALSPLAGYTPRLIRPPYGAVTDEELAWLKDEGYLTVNWNVDPEDWRGVSGEQVLKRSIEAAKPGAIILMHCATGPDGSLQGTIDALPELISGLRAKGYELVTLAQLLETNKGK
jgi:peptidoglycan/xylan/chitin deacetylase (PgdA/CDA1 family)